MKRNMFRKGLLVGILICILFIATTIPAVETILDDKLILNENIADLKQKINSCILKGWSEQDKINASDGAPDDYFGFSVSLDSKYAIVGAIYYENSMGAAYVFKRTGTTWIQEAKLTASDGEPNDLFGGSVSIKGNYALIGAPWDDYRKGAVYVFKRSGNTWIQEIKLTASDREAHDDFGMSVTLNENYALIGAYGDDNEKGSAYVFKHTGTSWVQEDKLLASDGEADDKFGGSVSLDDNYALIGAYGDTDNGYNTGSAYVFKHTGTSWVQEDKLLASDGDGLDSFGGSVSINGNYALIGAPGEHEGKGAAYAFKRTDSTWTEKDKLIASDGSLHDLFGCSVSLYGDYAIVGAKHCENFTGAAYVFNRTGTKWIEEDKLFASDGAPNDFFGSRVFLDANYVLIGVYGDDNIKGSAYIFKGPNHPPENPNIDGPTSGKPYVENLYRIVTNEPDKEEVYLWIDWGDDNETGWIGPYNSSEKVIIGHIWTSQGTYVIKVKAKDIFDAESEWATFTVTIPRSKATYNSFFLQFLERFPLLKQLFSIYFN